MDPSLFREKWPSKQRPSVTGTVIRWTCFETRWYLGQMSLVLLPHLLSPFSPPSLSQKSWKKNESKEMEIRRIMGNTIGWKEGEGRGEMDFRTYLMVLYHLIHTLGQKSRSEKWRESTNWRKCNNNKQCIIWRLDGFNGRRRYDSKV